MQNLTPAQRDVLDIIDRYGPLADHVTSVLVHHEKSQRQASSGVRTRRSELLGLGLVKTVGEVKMASGRRAHTFTTTAKGKKAAR